YRALPGGWPAVAGCFAAAPRRLARGRRVLGGHASATGRGVRRRGTLCRALPVRIVPRRGEGKGERKEKGKGSQGRGGEREREQGSEGVAAAGGGHSTPNLAYDVGWSSTVHS